MQAAKTSQKTPQNCFNLPKTSQKISVNIESILVSFAIFYLPKRLLFSRSRGGGMPIILWANSSAASIAADFFSRPIVQQAKLQLFCKRWVYSVKICILSSFGIHLYRKFNKVDATFFSTASMDDFILTKHKNTKGKKKEK